MEKKTALVIPTTHWDRDWYWSFERFRVKLIELFSVLKELWEKEPDYKFALDGQAIALEDYLEIFPEERALFEQMGKEGRFTLGPIYVQSDLYCTGAESFIRNLLIGRKIAKSVNAEQNAVYLPDTFGVIPEIPMLVKGFGIDVFIFMRGMPPSFPSDLRFFKWKTPDGSEVLTMRLRDGYANAARLGIHKGTGEIFDKNSSGIRPKFNMDMAVEKLKAATEKQVDGQGEPYILLAGVDHQVPQKELTDILSQTSVSHVSFKFSDFNEVASIMKNRDDKDSWYTYEGECHGFGASSILGGTVSTRIYLKQMNAEIERMLVSVTEPATAMVNILDEEKPEMRVLENAWKYLLKTHPHDDITGCGVDVVHKENEANMARAYQASDAISRKMAQYLINHYGGLSEKDNRYSFFLINTNSSPSVYVKKTLDFEGFLNWGDMKIPESFVIVDDSGEEVPFYEVRRGKTTEHPHEAVEVVIKTNIPPFTFSRFFLEEREGTNEKPHKLENEFLLAEILGNGGVSITNKSSGKRWENLMLFSDMADLGDEYTYSHIENDSEKIYSDISCIKSYVNQSNMTGVIKVGGNLNVPAFSTKEKRSCEITSIPFSMEYALAKGDKALRVNLTFTNTAKDHRLRINLSSDFIPNETKAGIKLNEITRETSDRIITKDNFAIDAEHPADHYVRFSNGKDGLALFSEFPFNYEFVKKDRPRLAVSVLRAVGYLSRNDMLTRGGGAGPDTPTPEAQCLNRRFDTTFAIMPFSDKEENSVFRESILFRSRASFGIIMGYEPLRKDVEARPIFSLKTDKTTVSTCKITENGNTILRLFNPFNKIIIEEVSLGFEGVIYEANLAEEEGKKIGENSCEIEIAPYALKTLLIKKVVP